MKKIVLSLAFLFSMSTFAGEVGVPSLTANTMDSYRVNVGGESYIKFVVYVDGEKLSVEYFDAKKMDLHVDYLKAIKGILLSAEEIYKQARFNEGRKYFFGALIFSMGETYGQEITSFQITAQDPLMIRDVIRIGQLLQSTLPEPNLAYMPSGNQAKSAMESQFQLQLTAAGFSVFQPHAYRTQTYYEATTVGRLKFVSAKDIEQGVYLVRGDEVLVLDYVPDSLPPVRGVITSAPTSPNSHVSLLARMYSIPFLFLAEAFTDQKLRQADGKTVLFKTTEAFASESMYLVETLEQPLYELYQDLWLQRFPKVDVRVNEEALMSLAEFPPLGQGHPYLSVDTCGAKASNGSVLASVLGAKNSITGFCIPFYYFNKFLLENKVGSLSLRAYILKEVSKISPLTKLEDVQSILLDIQQKIDLAQVSAADIQKIKAMILQTYGSNKTVNKVRFRSSSNAEDDERFNGAGLYESDGLKMKHILDDNDKKVEESLKIVWSSLYGLRAVLARKMFRIDESKVYMGILVNQAFEEAANGVSLCQKNYDNEVICKVEGYPGGELSVAIPVPGATSEIVTVAPNENYPFGVMTRVEQFTSELGQYERVLSEKELGELYSLQVQIYKFWTQKKSNGFAGTLDFEWKKMRDPLNGEFYMALKQVREVPPQVVV